MAMRFVLALFLLPAVSATKVTHTANPIRKVVLMLQKMTEQVTLEGEKEEKAFKEFMCYCKTGVGTLEESIEAAKTKIDTLDSQLKESFEQKKMTEEALKEHGDSRIEAKEAVAKATALRDEEHKEYMQEKSDYETNMSAVKAAVAAIEKGMGSSFLQSKGARAIARFAMEKATMQDAQRQVLLSFLSGTTDYSPKSGQIVGILKQMGDEMAATLADITEVEEKAQSTFNQMIAAKTKEINALTAQIEEEMMRLGELNMLLADGGNDLEETKETLKEDQQYLVELEKGCATKEKEWEARQKVRAEELVALAQTIKILNDDDALELFKKTLPAPGAALLQIQESSASVRARAAAMLRSKPRHSAQLDIVMLALQGKKIGFEKVIKLIDDMNKNLAKEQEDDDNKKIYCEAELDKEEDNKKELERAIEVSDTAIEELTGAIATWTQEIAELKKSIRELDASVAEATKLRKEQNAEYKELMKENKATKEILLLAKNRLNKFYNPKLYKEETAFVEVRAHRSDSEEAPPPPPETFGAYTTKHEESSGVIAMIDKLVLDTDTTMTEAETEEKDAQAAYEKLMTDASNKRTADSKSLTDKTASKAQAEEALQAEGDKKKGLEEEKMETMKILMNLHAECDWLLKYFDVRRAARADEMDALSKAKDVLNGADYSLLQTGRKSRRGNLRIA
jgi:predicted  nucleic acid-binding Zn-ribbon protein